MAKKKNKAGLIVGLLAVGGLAYWYFTKQTATAATPTTTLTPGTIPTPVPALPAPGGIPLSIPATLPTIAPTIITPTPTSTSPAPIVTTPLQVPVTATTDNRVATIQAWANSTLSPANLAQFNLMEPNFTQADWAGLFDLYFNDWTGGQGNNAARTAFWNNWRTTYHINDGTYP